ncbi:MAG TPA: DUF2339 domain-containing protein [Longimicrobium sp.]|nr:DUF2339 domain-containing protein [Longimicrobium sp.]
MTASLEERLFTAERLLAGLIRERAGVATDEDLQLLRNAGIAFGRLVREPASPPVQAVAPASPPAPPSVRVPARPPAPVPLAATVGWRPGEDEDEGYDLVPGPRRRALEPEPTPAERWIAARMKATPGDWVARAGMALLLFGIAFLCKYSIDQGWITPALRVSAGGAAGAALVGLGLRTHRTSRPFSGLFLGGGIGAWYTAAYAAYELYHLLPFSVAFALMAATTAAAFGLALWSGIETLAVVGALGGIGTPFVLSSDRASVPGLVAYLLTILCFTSGTYLARRWRTGFAVGVAGTWTALAAALAALPAGGAPVSTRVALSIGFLGVLVAGWRVFLLPRTWPARFQPSAREAAAHAWWARALSLPEERVRVLEGYVAVVVPFFVAWGSLAAAWSLSARSSGYLGTGVVWVAGFAFAALRPRLPALARAHAFAAAAAGAAVLALVGRNVPETVIALVIYGTLLHACERAEPLGRPVRLLAQGVMAVAALALAQGLATPGDLAVRVALLAVSACAYAVSAERVSGVGRPVRDVYRLAGHGFAALLLWALCAPVPHAGGWFAVSLSAFAAALCLLERRPEGAAVLAGRPVDGVAALACHGVALVTALGFCGVFGDGAVAWYNERAAAQLALIASLAAGAVLAGPGRRRGWLGGVGYGLWLLAVADQFSGVAGGAALTTGTWAATGLAVLIATVRRRAQGGVRVALGTLALVCAKLFLVDLANLEPVWRILLFMGVGAGFLAVSYFVRAAWLAEEPADERRVSLAG